MSQQTEVNLRLHDSAVNRK